MEIGVKRWWVEGEEIVGSADTVGQSSTRPGTASRNSNGSQTTALWPTKRTTRLGSSYNERINTHGHRRSTGYTTQRASGGKKEGPRGSRDHTSPLHLR